MTTTYTYYFNSSYDLYTSNMKSRSHSILTLLIVFAVLLGSLAVPVSAAPTEPTDSDGEARTVIATPGGPTDRAADRPADVTGEIVLDDGRDTRSESGASGTITISIDTPEEASNGLPDGRRIIREVGSKH